jgi:hypothetical protein
MRIYSFFASHNFKFDNHENWKVLSLKNIEDNLALIYPHEHHFSIENNKNVFNVDLTIDLKNEHTLFNYWLRTFLSKCSKIIYT